MFKNVFLGFREDNVGGRVRVRHGGGGGDGGDDEGGGGGEDPPALGCTLRSSGQCTLVLEKVPSEGS